jgi:hypothetical protein
MNSAYRPQYRTFNEGDVSSSAIDGWGVKYITQVEWSVCYDSHIKFHENSTVLYGNRATARHVV